ncbi:MAG: hypothetical protein DRO99_02290 [Candidatus Aenigmatarchaeota archaeon]|nr:MAG: hypothetical protein DRO99_02290 [Candidatus Aenigmarchaeota archaeon]
MPDSAFGVLYEIVTLVVSNTIGTVHEVLSLFYRFCQHVGLVMGSSFGGFVLGLILFGVVGIFIAKFFMSSGKTVMVLLAAAAILLVILFAGMY